MSIPNINPVTGIPYGVISGKNVPDLVDMIMGSGTSLTAQAAKDELTERLRSVVSDYVVGGSSVAAVTAMTEELVEIVWDRADLDYGEEEYEWTDDEGIKYHLGYLGGAILIWVEESPYFTHAPPCSPCVRNAGDLDSAHNDYGEIWCYCPNPESLPHDVLTGMKIYKKDPRPPVGGEEFEAIQVFP